MRSADAVAKCQDMELKANETDKLIKGMSLKPTDDSLKYDWNTEARHLGCITSGHSCMHVDYD